MKVAMWLISTLQDNVCKRCFEKVYRRPLEIRPSSLLFAPNLPQNHRVATYECWESEITFQILPHTLGQNYKAEIQQNQVMMIFNLPIFTNTWAFPVDPRRTALGEEVLTGSLRGEKGRRNRTALRTGEAHVQTNCHAAEVPGLQERSHQRSLTPRRAALGPDPRVVNSSLLLSSRGFVLVRY